MRKILFAFILSALALSLSAQPRNQKITVSGHVADSLSGETLIGAGAIYDASNRTGAATNSFGFYSLTFTPSEGPVRIMYSYVGYKEKTVTLNALKDTVINVLLEPSGLIDESRVVASREAGFDSPYLGAIDVPLDHIRNTPALLGEQDVLKAIQLMPGVQGGNEGFAGLYVRGGGPDENLILLDGVPIYNVDHLLGLFSVFQPEAVKKVTLYKGSFPARYGGRVSSIIDIRANDGNMKETHGMVSVGVVSDKMHLEGPIIKDRLSYSVSARGMHTALYSPLIKWAMNNPGSKDKEYANYYFYDLTGKLTWRLSDKDRFYFGLYKGGDKFKYYDNSKGDKKISYGAEVNNESYTSHEGVNLHWGNNLASLRWNHVFSGRLFSNTTIAYNRYLSTIGSEFSEKGTTNGIPYKEEFDVKYRSGIRDLSAKMDFDFNPNPSHLVKFGAEYLFHTFIPETLTAVNESFGRGEEQIDTLMNIIDSKRFHGHDLSFYVEDDFTVGERLTINPGAHVSLFYTEGRGYLSFQPRLSVRYSFNKDLSMKAGYSRMAQYVHLLSSSQLSLPIDLWVPITKDIRPVTSDQGSLGIYYNGVKDWEFSAEGYWKEMYNILEYKDGAVVIGNMGGWEKQVEMGRGRALGLELFAQKVSGDLTGWVSYTLAKSDRWFPEGTINMGKKFPYKYDRRHSLNLVANYKLSDRVDLNGAWTFATGGTSTIPLRSTEVMYLGLGRTVSADLVASRNNYRLPSSHRLNIGVSLHKPKRNGEAVWNFSIYNTYNQMNPNFVYMDTRTEETVIDGKKTYVNKRVLNKITILPIVPSVSYTRKF